MVMKSEGDKKLSVLIKEKASELGFDLCGIAKTKVLSDNGRILEKWCEAGMNAGMSYLQRNIERRINPGLLMPGAKSIVVTGLCYYSELRQRDPRAPVLSRYAYGLNYHDVITPMLEKLMEFIRTLVPDCEGRIFCDSGPLLEKAWARQAGLGWQGRHSIMINEKIGSFFFIGELFLNIELDYDKPPEGEKCGNCNACIDHCPTNAINSNRTIDARRCIANLTIGNRGAVPDEIIPLMGRMVYSCDICQEVCPWNSKARPHNVPEFLISEELANLSKDEWLTLSKDKFDSLFKGTPVERVKFDRFKRNIVAISGNL